jgi:hypothetical protein
MAKNPVNTAPASTDTIPTAEPTSAPAASTAKKRAAVAKRNWIDADGKEVSEELATGVEYTNIATGQKYVYQTGGKPGHPAVMLACFGALTLMGNVANTRVNGLGGTGEEAIADIKERFDLLASGKWIERGEGAARGPKYDLGKLATALITALRGKGKDVPDSKHGDFLAKLTEDKSYFAKVRSNPDVQAEYAKLVGRTAKDVSELDI